MRTRLLIPLLVLAAVVAGCNGSSQATDVQVHGTVQTVGGPAPGAPSPIAGARFRLVGNGTSVSVRADDAGRFAVALAPGSYRVDMSSHVPMADGQPLPARPRRIRVAGTPAAPVHLFVDIR